MAESTPSGGRFKRIARDVAIVLVIFLGLRLYQTRGLPDGAAPALEGQNLAGERVSLSDFAGEPVVVYFWASWCGVCKAIEGSVDSLAEGHKVIRVAVHSGGAEALDRAVPEGTPGRELILLDASGRAAAAWGVGAFPTLFWINGAGEIVFSEVGYTSGLGMKARALLTR